MEIKHLKEKLRLRCEQVKALPNFYEAISLHHQINKEIYRKQPLFYKVILQETRFNIVLAACCLVYGHQASSISQIKELCAHYKIASPNSVIAIISLLKVGGRLRTFRDSQDRRKLLIEPTDKGLNDLKHYMEGAFRPLALLCPGHSFSSSLLDRKQQRCDFFNRAADYLFRGIVYKNMLPEACLFLDKDAGRMIMLELYSEARHQSQEPSVIICCSWKALARKFSVSRTHIRRLIQAAAERELLSELPSGDILLHPAYFTLVEDYMGFYFSWALHYLNVEPESIHSGTADESQRP